VELREIDAIHVVSGRLVNDPNTHCGRTFVLAPWASSVYASNNVENDSLTRANERRYSPHPGHKQPLCLKLRSYLVIRRMSFFRTLRSSSAYVAHGLPIAAALAISGCTNSSLNEITAPDPATKCQSDLTGLPASVSSSASRLSATVSTNRECSWTLTSDASWIQVRPTSGQGPASVSVDVSENPAALERSAALVLGDNRVTVTQEPAPCRFELGSGSSRVAPQGGPFQIAVSTIVGCKWRASSAVPWVRVVSSEVTGSGSAEFAADVNSGDERSGTLTIAGLPHVVQQAGRVASPVPPPPSPPAPPSPTPPSPPPPAPLTLEMEPTTMPIGYLGERFAGVTVRARGGTGPYRITGKNLLGWPSSLDYKVDPVAGTALWHGIVTRTGEFPVRMTVEDSKGATSELMLTFVFKTRG
jgi:hypothetical protein